MPDTVSFRIDETTKTPMIGLVFGWGAMLPFVFGAAAAWTLRDTGLAVWLTIIWGGGILSFLAGVRRGLSFRTPGGEDFAQIATMLWLFLLAVAALVSPPAAALILLIIGFASIAVLDPRAAAHREAPPFFARLRPVQMLVPVASLGAILCRVLLSA